MSSVVTIAPEVIGSPFRSPRTEQPAIGHLGPLVKICGATSAHDIARIAHGGADLVGIWYAVPGGEASLGRHAVTRLARVARRSAGLEPTIVTCSDDVGDLASLVRAAGVGWIQLHAYQRPGTVAALKEAVPGCRVVKVLHLAEGRCVEQGFIGRYERAGVDAFLVDVVAPGRIGSTGRALPEEPALRLLDEVDRPVLLAGGLSVGNSGRYHPHRRHPRFLGADFDSNARDGAGRISTAAVAALTSTWGRESPVLALTAGAVR